MNTRYSEQFARMEDTYTLCVQRWVLYVRRADRNPNGQQSLRSLVVDGMEHWHPGICLAAP